MVPPLGSHMSIAGGVDRAPGLAAQVGATALQIFVKNNNRWEGRPFREDEPAAFRAALEKAAIPLRHVFAHTSYLINLASADADVVRKSIVALRDELERCDVLGVPGLVMHPGSPGKGEAKRGIEAVARLSAEVIDSLPAGRARILFETTAGTGANLGARFEELGEILHATARPDRTGVCLDTCHIFAAGYELRTREAYEESMAAFEKHVGFARLHAVHLNDSMAPFGSRKDRHEHIGRGQLGEAPFRFLLHDPRFAAIPMALETDKGEDLAEDRMNLATLHRLAAEPLP